MAYLQRLVTWYLVAVGLTAHLLVGAVWLLAPQYIRGIKEGVITRLDAQLPSLALGEAATQPVSDLEVRRVIPAWAPLSAAPDAPPPGKGRVGGKEFGTLNQAVAALTSGATLDIGPGVYTGPLKVRTPGVSLVGHGSVVFEKGVVEGKAFLVIAADGVTVRNIECRGIQVGDGNGACIRLEGKDLTVDHVYFHDSQEGILTGQQSGLVDIRGSRFERLGHGGQAHGIYIGGGRLHIADSQFLSSQGEGHEIKTRSRETLITRSVIASLNGVDSRLIDASAGGVLSVTDSVLEEGPNSVNHDVIGYALEARSGPRPEDRVVLRNNLILIDNPHNSNLLHLRDETVPTDVVGNRIVAPQGTPFAGNNQVFNDRKAAGLPAYPALPLPTNGTAPTAH